MPWDFFLSSISAIKDFMVSLQLRISFSLPPPVSNLVYRVVYSARALTRTGVSKISKGRMSY